MKKRLLMTLLCLLGAGPPPASAAPVACNLPAADTIYFGGPILTMEGDRPNYVEALLVKDGKIIFAGSQKTAEKHATARQRIDLQGKTLLPGFIDAHGHAFV